MEYEEREKDRNLGLFVCLFSLESGKSNLVGKCGVLSRQCEVVFENYGQECKVRPVSLHLFFFSTRELLG